MNTLIAQHIAGYRLEALLGEGGMGSVYRAVDLRTGRRVAIKIMHPHLARQPHFRALFEREAQAVRRLRHPGIIATDDAGEDDGRVYLVTEYLAGGNLTAYVNRLQWQGRPLPLAEASSMVARLADALHYAHAQGVIHRDVKTDNILLRRLPNGDRAAAHVVLTDFGLALLLEEGDRESTNPVLGTLPYMAPEQFSDQPIDGRADLYSLGVVLYQLATGRLPFEAKSPFEFGRQHREELPPLPRDLNPSITPELEATILQALAKAPTDRFATGEALAAALRKAGAAPVANGAVAPALPSALTQLEGPQWVGSVHVPSRLDVYRTWHEGRFRLLVARLWGQPRIHSLDTPYITIGRALDNDIVLDDAHISRRHAVLEQRGGGWDVVDVDSTNGVYLGKQRLPARNATPWSVDETLRIGPFFLRWQALDAVPAGALAEAPADAPPPGLLDEPSAGQNRIVVSAPPSDVTVHPGQAATFTIELFNQGNVVDHLRLVGEGLPGPWIVQSDGATPGVGAQLLPGQRQTLTVTVRLPAGQSAVAGSYPCRLLIHSQVEAGVVESRPFNVHIAPVVSFEIDLHPRELRGRGRRQTATARPLIINEGNTRARYIVEVRDPADDILFDEPRQRVVIPPGQRGAAQFQLRPRWRPMLGATRILPFTVRAGPEEGDLQAMEGRLEVRPWLPYWLLLLLLLLGAATVFGGNLVASALNEREERAIEAEAALAAASTIGAAERATIAVQSKQDAATLQAARATGDPAAIATAVGQQVTRTAAAVRDTARAQQPPTDTADGQTATPQLGPTPLPTATPPPTDTPPPTVTPSPSPTPTPTPTPTPSPSPTLTPTPTPVPPPVLAIEPAEGELTPGEGSGQVTLTIALRGVVTQPVELSYQTIALDQTLDDSAVPGMDYRHASDILRWEPGDAAAKRITISILNDSPAEIENDEFFLIRFEPPVNALWSGANEVTVRIVDNDVRVVWEKLSETVIEGDPDGNETILVLQVAIQGVSDRPVTVGYESIQGEGEGEATAGEDYFAARGTLTWNPGQTAGQTIEVTIRRDRRAETPAEEQFTVTLTANSPNVVIYPDQATLTVTILDDDEVGLVITPPNDGWNLVDVPGPGAWVEYQIALTSRPTAIVTIALAAFPQGKVQFKIGQSDWKLDSESITFQPDNWSQPKTIRIRTREKVEQDDGESYVVTISHSSTDSHYFIDVPVEVEVNVTDNDTATLTLDVPGKIDEGKTAEVIAKLNMPHIDGVTVKYELSEVEAEDYGTPTPTGSILTFAAGSDALLTISIPILADCDTGPEDMVITLIEPVPDSIKLPQARAIQIINKNPDTCGP